MFVFVWNKGLPKETIAKIKNRTYTQEEITTLYNQITKEHTTKSAGQNRAYIIFGIVLLMFILISLKSSMSSGRYSIISLLFTIPYYVLIIFFVKWLWGDKEKRQFKKALKKGYPELVDRCK